MALSRLSRGLLNNSAIRLSDVFAPELHHTAQRFNSTTHLPRIARPSLWKSLVPRSFRKDSQHDDLVFPSTKPPHWTSNPGFPLIALGLVVGSFAINILSLRREMVTFSRQTEAKLELLREVVGKVKAGEKVDVKKLLGTGDAKSEAEWEEVMQELETSDLLSSERARRAQKVEGNVQATSSTSSTNKPAAQNQNKPKFMM